MQCNAGLAYFALLCTVVQAPSFGFPGGSRMACSGHKRPGMQYLKHGEGAEDVASKVRKVTPHTT